MSLKSDLDGTQWLFEDCRGETKAKSGQERLKKAGLNFKKHLDPRNFVTWLALKTAPTMSNNEKKEEGSLPVANEDFAREMTCSALCILGSSSAAPGGCADAAAFLPMEVTPKIEDDSSSKAKCKSNRSCPKQLQLPMFLSSK